MSSTDSDCISETVRDVLNKTLEQDPLKRISASSLLQHPWFNVHILLFIKNVIKIHPINIKLQNF